jgi:DNA recombination protein RmuC
VGGALYDARQAYDEAFKQLSTGRGNLVSQVEMLRKLGVAPKGRKQIPARMIEDAEIEDAEIEEPTLALTAEADENGETAL